MYYDDKDQKSLSSTVFLFLAIVGFFFVIIEGFFLNIGFSFFKVQVPFFPYMVLALIAMYGASFNLIPLRFFRITYQSSQFLIWTSTFVIIDNVCSITLIWYFHLGVAGKILGNCIAVWIMAVIYSVIMVKKNGFILDWNRIRNGFKFSLPLLPGAYAIVAQTMVDRLILERYEPIDKLGIYSIAFLLATSVNIIINSFFFVIEPKIYQLHREVDFLSQFIQLKKYLFFLVGIIVGCFILFSRQIVFILLGSKYRESSLLIPIICFSSFIALGTNLYQQLILLKNRTSTMSSISIISALSGIGLNLLLIPRIGNYGAAITISCSALIGYVICSAISRSAYKEGLSVMHELGIGATLLLSYPLVILVDKYDMWKTFAIKIVLFGMLIYVILRILKVNSGTYKAVFGNALQLMKTR
jgi:O-antigen/teichoic acid export membrane protein